ncbi:MAG: aconitase family protein [Candidatus Hodarchaeales archaeon]|jgi:3-isopropylmalate/(R)-2-methylmalate dehydratase large subunit
MAGLTLIEKIIKNHLSDSDEKIYSGNIVWVNLDLITARDYAGPQVINLFEKNYPESAVFNKDRIILTPDCYPYGNDPKHAIDQETLRIFSNKHNVHLTDLGSGIGSHLIFKRGYVVPGDIVIGADSHYNLLGALGILGQGAGDVMLSFAFKTGKYWIKVPDTIKVTLEGSYNWPTTAKDLALYVLLKLHELGVTGKSIEFYGDVISKLSIAERITLCSLITEASGLIGFVPPDNVTAEYYKKYSGKKIELISADSDARYSKEITINIENLGIYVACPPHPHNVKPIEEVLDISINSVVIGSCTNGTAEDIRQATQIIGDRKIDTKTRLGIIPATREDVIELAKDGSYMKLLDAGANFFGTGCSTCAKGQYGLTGDSTAVTMTTGNRNTQGKIGPAPVYLVSPVVAAATAIKGKISLPDDEC